MAWVPVNLYYLVLPLLPGTVGSLAATGSLRAAVNLIVPMMQINGALGVLMVSAFSARLASGKSLDVWRVCCLFLGIAVCYWLAIIFLGEEAASLLYGGSYFDVLPHLWILGLVPIATGMVTVFRAVALARERPNQVFWSNLLAAIITVALGIPLGLTRELRGVAVGMVVSMAIQAMALAYSSRTTTSIFDEN